MTYYFDVKGQRVPVDAWQPATFFSIGEYVQCMVQVNAYVSRRGSAMYSLNIPGNRDFGEPF